MPECVFGLIHFAFNDLRMRVTCTLHTDTLRMPRGKRVLVRNMLQLRRCDFTGTAIVEFNQH
jgi:hypothetical protein